MGEESIVGEVPQAASIIGHNICGARDIVNTLDITMVSLMQGRKAEEVCTGGSSGGGTVLLPCNSRSVVRTTGRSEFGNGVVLGEEARELAQARHARVPLPLAGDLPLGRAAGAGWTAGGGGDCRIGSFACGIAGHSPPRGAAGWC